MAEPKEPGLTDAGRPDRVDRRHNQTAIEAAATKALHANGLRIPMAEPAANANVGIGTLYRHFPTRHALMTHLTNRSFTWLLTEIRAAADSSSSGASAIQNFLERILANRGNLVLPLHGGPPVTDQPTQLVRAEIKTVLDELIKRGLDDGSIKRPTGPWDIAVLGATLAQPHRDYPHWDDMCRRLIETYIAGLQQKLPESA